ncbi:MAG: putative quinol monooxygenase [Acidobacteriota bacterium]
MSVIVIFEAQAKPGSGDQFVAALRQTLASTRSYEGCLELTVHQNQDDSDNLVAVERWASREAYERYLQWRRETGVLDRLTGACIGPPRIRFYDVTDA